MSFKTLRKEVCEANKELEKQTLLFLDKGSATGIDRERGVVVAKPAEIPHACLTPEDMLVLDLDGTVVEGKLTAGLDVAAHLFLYQAYREIAGIANTFSPYATMIAQADRPIPCYGIVHARCFKGDIPVTRTLRKPEIERHYEKSVGAVIVERFSRLDVLAIPGVVVAHHGAFAWGRTVGEAVLKSLALEKAAHLAYGTLMLSPHVPSISGILADKYFDAQ